MKRVIIFIGNFSFGGAEVVGVNLANSMINMDMEVTILCLKDQGGLKQRLSQKVKVVNLNTRLLFCLSGLRKFILCLDKNTVFISSIRNLNIACSLATIRSKPVCKFIYQEANTYRNLLNTGFKDSIIWLTYFLIINLSYRKAGVIVANSNDTKADLKFFCNSFTSNKIKVIGNPININQNNPSMIKKEPMIFKNKQFNPVILSVGRLHPQKDYFLGLRVFRIILDKYPNARYVILGEGNLDQDLKNFSASLGLQVGVNVFFEGTTPNPEHYYMRSDLFFMTSQWEGFGNVIVEAMGYGITPVVCKCPGGPHDIIKSEYGYYINSRSSEVVASVLEQALENKITKVKLTKRANDFRPDYIAEQYLDSVV